MEKDFYLLFNSKLSEMEINLSVEQKNQFWNYYNLLIEWNKVMNLTAITEMDEVILKHFVDSLLLIKAIDNLDQFDLSILDVGTGAGFPGIPLKIAFPNLNVTLLDSLNKRVRFLNEVILKLGLDNIKAVHGRAEDYGRDTAFRENFDIVVSRAVANIAVLAEYCIPFVKINGFFIPYKSGNIDNEIKNGKKAISELGGLIDNIITYKLPSVDIGRSLIIIRKKISTKNKYPRKSGLPSKEPLG